VKASGQWKQYLSWGVAIVLGVVPYYFDLGIFAGVEWYVAIVYSLGAALVANGLADVEQIKALLRAIKLEPAKNNRPPL